jgi:hypothetical protein
VRIGRDAVASEQRAEPSVEWLWTQGFASAKNLPLM